MGDNYEIYGLYCAYCKAKQNECYYADSSGHTEHKCKDCGKINKIQQIFQLVKMKK